MPSPVPQANQYQWHHDHHAAGQEPQVRHLTKPDPANGHRPDQPGVFGAGDLVGIHLPVGQQHGDVVTQDEQGRACGADQDLQVPRCPFPECQCGCGRYDQQVVQEQLVHGGLFFRQLPHHDGVDGQGKGGTQGGDDGPVELHRAQYHDDAGKAAEYGGDAQGREFFPKKHGGQHHDQYRRGVEQGVGGGQRQVGEGDHHAYDADQVDGGTAGGDFQASEKVACVEFAGQWQQEHQGEYAAQEGELEDGGAGVHQFDEDVREYGHGVADDQQQNGAVDGFA